MATPKILAGDSFTFKATFLDEDGIASDPDNGIITFTAYDADNTNVIVQTGSSLKLGIGLYAFTWTTPARETSYVLEMKGIFEGKPQLNRLKIRVKFRI